MYRVNRYNENYYLNCDFKFNITKDNNAKTIAYFTSLYNAVKYCESQIQTIKIDICDTLNTYAFHIDKMLVDENGAFTKIDKDFNCKIYTDTVKYIGE